MGLFVTDGANGDHCCSCRSAVCPFTTGDLFFRDVILKGETIGSSGRGTAAVGVGSEEIVDAYDVRSEPTLRPGDEGGSDVPVGVGEVGVVERGYKD